MIYLLTNRDEERLQIAEVVARACWPQYMRSKVLYISTPTHAASPRPFFICVDLSISEKKMSFPAQALGISETSPSLYVRPSNEAEEADGIDPKEALTLAFGAIDVDGLITTEGVILSRRSSEGGSRQHDEGKSVLHCGFFDVWMVAISMQKNSWL